jgi:hypothetical protein
LFDQPPSDPELLSQWKANGPFNIIKHSWDLEIDIIEELEYTTIESDIYTG